MFHSLVVVEIINKRRLVSAYHSDLTSELNENLDIPKETKVNHPYTNNYIIFLDYSVNCFINLVYFRTFRT